MQHNVADVAASPLTAAVLRPFLGREPGPSPKMMHLNRP